jgi:adenosylhomocysteinase
MGMKYRVKDISLAPEGKKKIDWAEIHMPVLVSLRKRLQDTLPLKGLKISGCLHVTKETGVLIRTIGALGADIAWSGCNP